MRAGFAVGALMPMPEHLGLKTVPYYPGSKNMAPLIRFLLINLIGGFTIGLVVGFSFMLSNGKTELLVQEPLAAALLLWGFAASFGMGAIGTALALLRG